MLRVRLFGRFHVCSEGGSPVELRAQKPRELLAYLLLHARRTHRREALASMLWGEMPTARSKKYLRQALWQLQSTFRSCSSAAGAELLLISPESVEVNPVADLWTDVGAFDETHATVRGQSAQSFDADTVRLLEETVDLHHGELLDGWYSDWLLADRERLEERYLGFLEKLLAYHAAHQDQEKGMTCALRILSHDLTRENAHRELMRFHYRAGDRAAALRQYAQCSTALAEELDVEPSAETVALYEQIRSDRQPRNGIRTAVSLSALPQPSPALPEIVDRLQRAKQVLSDLRDQVQNDIHSLEQLLRVQAAPGTNAHRTAVASNGARLSN